MSRIALLITLALLLTACSPKAAPPPAAPPPPSVPAAVAPNPPAPPPAPAPRTFGPVPDLLARPVKEGGPQRRTLAAGETVNKPGAYFLNVESGKGEAWLYPDAQGWLGFTISEDNRFLTATSAGAGYLIDRQGAALWQWDVETAQPLLVSGKGSLFAEMEKKGPNLLPTGRYFWTGPDFRPVRSFVPDVAPPVWTRSAVLSPDGQQLALLVQGETPSLLLVDLRSGAQRSLPVPGAGGWIGSLDLALKGSDLQLSVWVSEGNRSTDQPRWNQLIRLYGWQGGVQSDRRIPGNYTFFSPNGKWVAWQEAELLEGLAPVTVIAGAATLKPELKVLGASTCFSSAGSAGTRWLADSSGLVLATTAGQYRLLTMDGKLAEPPGFAGRSWKDEPQPAPDKKDRIAFGRLQVLDGIRQLELKLEGFVTPSALAPWGSSSKELRFTLPPKAGGGACYELPAIDPLVLKANEPVPEFPLVVQSSDCLPLRTSGQEGLCLPRGTRLKPMPDANGRPALTFSGGFTLKVQTGSGQTGWISLAGHPVTWAR